jgi:hypothetical protein
MFETSIHLVHPYLSRYINGFATMKLNQNEPFSAVFTAKPDSVLMFNIGYGSNDISIGFDFVHYGATLAINVTQRNRDFFVKPNFNISVFSV